MLENHNALINEEGKERCQRRQESVTDKFLCSVLDLNCHGTAPAGLASDKHENNTMAASRRAKYFFTPTILADMAVR